MNHWSFYNLNWIQFDLICIARLRKDIAVTQRFEVSISLTELFFWLAYMWCSGTSQIVGHWHITRTTFIDHTHNFNATSLLELETNVIFTIFSWLIQKNECSRFIMFADDATVVRLITKSVCAASNAKLFWQESHGWHDGMHTETLIYHLVTADWMRFLHQN